MRIGYSKESAQPTMGSRSESSYAIEGVDRIEITAGVITVFTRGFPFSLPIATWSPNTPYRVLNMRGEFEDVAVITLREGQ